MERVYKTFTVPYQSSKMTFLITKNIAVFPACSRFPVKLIYCIAFGLASGDCCVRSIAISFIFLSSMHN